MPLRKIKLLTLLLSLFLFTIVISSAAIILFTYRTNSKSVHELSVNMISRSGARIYERIGCVVDEAGNLPAFGNLLVSHRPEISLSNRDLIVGFLGILKHDPHLYAFSVGKPDGSYLVAINLAFPKDLSVPYEPPPKDAAFALLFSNKAAPDALQTRAFFDPDLSLLSTREAKEGYDPRNRPWYQGAEKNKKLYWTDPYPYFYSKNSVGFSATQPFYDSAGNLEWVISADLSLQLFSQFLEEHPITEHGKAYILDGNGNILLPPISLQTPQGAILEKAFQTYKVFRESNFSYKSGGKSYLASRQPFPIPYEKQWSLFFIAPYADFFAKIEEAQRVAVLLSLAILIAASLLAIALSIHISKPIVQIAHEIDRIARLDLDSTARISSRIEEIGMIDSSVASMRIALRSFAHYVPKELAKELMRKEHEIALGGEKKTITIFFTDIADFTSIAEMLPIEKVNALLTEYFQGLTQIILQCGGTIDKYIGDSIMSIWGAPEDLPDFAARACTAALLCQRYLDSFNRERRKERMPEFLTRMGLRTGPVIVGNFGTAERMNYSAIGDPVNTAARLQGLNKNYHTRIILGEDTLVAIGPQFLVRPLDIVEVRGKKEKLKIYELVAKRGGEPEIQPSPQQLKLSAAFADAFKAFEAKDLVTAKKLFQAIHDQFPEDFPTSLYLQRLS